MEYIGTREEMDQMARMRVEHNKELMRWYTVIFDQDWPNWDEHLDWLITAPVDEIVDWAETVSRDE